MLSPLIGGILTGSVLLFNWASRHPSLVFFESTFLGFFRFFLLSSLFTVLFSLLYAINRYLSGNTPKKTFFIAAEKGSFFLLPLLLAKRYFIISRAAGNRYYLWVFLSWSLLHPILFFLSTDQKTRRAIPEKLFLLGQRFLKKIDFFFSKKPINFYYLLYLSLHSLFLSSRYTPSFLLKTTVLFYLFFYLSLLPILHRIFSRKESIAVWIVLLFSVLLSFDLISYHFSDFHFLDAFRLVFGEGIAEIPKLLEGADLSPLAFFASLFFLLLLPFAGLYAYHKLPKKNIHLRPITPLLSASLFFTFIFLAEQRIEKTLPPEKQCSYLKNTPFHSFFVRPKKEIIAFRRSFPAPPTEESTRKYLSNEPLSGEKKPFIFLIVIESLREDFLNEKTAPFLTEFKKTSPRFTFTSSNANVTHISYFSIFNGYNPLYWMTCRNREDTEGSLPLRLLQRSGYLSAAFHSSHFKFYRIDEVLFGKNRSLPDHLYEGKKTSENVALRDRNALKEIKEYLSDRPEGAPLFCTLLLDSTHHHYYWDTERDPPFVPYLKAFNYANKGKKQLELTKNRYRNAIHYVDSLLEEFISFLKKEDLYDSSLIVITGDHGEEFLEQGHYFHGSALCFEQFRVPIYYKFPSSETKKVHQPITSHVDIFPTIFDVIGIPVPEGALFGRSLFSPGPPMIFACQSSPRGNPHRFYLFDGQVKLEAQFTREENIYAATSIEVIGIKDSRDKPLPDRTPLTTFRQPLEELFQSALDTHPGTFLNQR